MRFVNDSEFLSNPTKYLQHLSFSGTSDCRYVLRADLQLPLVSSDSSVDVTRYPREFVVWIPLVASTEAMQDRIDRLIPECKALLEHTVGLGLVNARVVDTRDDPDWSRAHIALGQELIHCANSTYEVWRRVDTVSAPYLIPRSVWLAGWVGMPAPTQADVVVRK